LALVAQRERERERESEREGEGRGGERSPAYSGGSSIYSPKGKG